MCLALDTSFEGIKFVSWIALYAFFDVSVEGFAVGVLLDAITEGIEIVSV